MPGIDMDKLMKEKGLEHDEEDDDDRKYRFYDELGKELSDDDSDDVDNEELSDDQFLNRSKKDFMEFKDHGGSLKLLTNGGDIVDTTSTNCGDGEILFCHDGLGFIRMWFGSDDMNFVYNYPDLCLSFDPDRDGNIDSPTVVTSIQEFDLGKVFMVYDVFRSRYEDQSKENIRDILTDEEIAEEMPSSEEEMRSLSDDEREAIRERLREKAIAKKESME